MTTFAKSSEKINISYILILILTYAHQLVRNIFFFQYFVYILSERSLSIFFNFQVVGNLIYYRYMNPAIVAPDAFDIVDVSVEKGLTANQVSNHLFRDLLKFSPPITMGTISELINFCYT